MYYHIYLLTFGTILGQMLFPVWFFQGIEKMKYITYLNIIAKLIFTFAIFIFVHEKSDYYLVPIFTSLGFISIGLISIYIIKKDFQIIFKLQSFKIIKNYLVDGWHIFLSRLYLNL
jgi:PST family polysaccharide transporter